MKHSGARRRWFTIRSILVACAVFGGVGILMLNIGSADPQTSPIIAVKRPSVFSNISHGIDTESFGFGAGPRSEEETTDKRSRSCATVEEMGQEFNGDSWKEESLRVRKLIHQHFAFNGASTVRHLSPEKFCQHGYVMGKASEAGFGNEMYKILSSAALSIMLNRSLIIGQTRGKFPFGDYISYSNVSFTLKEIKHLWRHNNCEKKYGRRLIIRTDNFEKPMQTNVLCCNWNAWKQPIIWFQGTTDAVAVQFFLKNIHPEMKDAASNLFGKPEFLKSRPNVFGELMRILVSPSEVVEEAVSWVVGGGTDPDVSLHMRMLMNRPARALQAALNCIRKVTHTLDKESRPRVVLVSDTPSLVKSITPNISKFAEVVTY